MTATLVGERPQPYEPRPWKFPAFERREVAGGRVIACHLPGKPLAVLSLVVDAGAVAEPAGHEGAALILARCLSEGTKTRDAYGFALAGERLGASWRSDIDWDSLRCGFEVPAGALLPAAELLAEAVRSPALDDATVERVRDERLDEIMINFSQPGPRAMASFVNAVFTPSSRYCRSDGGDVGTVTGIGPAEVRGFHAARFAPGAATLVVVGDLDGTDVDAVGRAVFDGWTGETPPLADTTVDVNPGGRRIVLVDRPGSVQSMLYFGHDAPSRETPDYVPMTTMALALGGMFNSRLNMRLREDKGYTYGAFGGFDCRRHGGTFIARAAVHTEVTAPALSDLVTELQLMHDKGLTRPSWTRPAAIRAGIFPVNFAAPGPVAGGIGDLVVHGHPDDHFDRLRAEIQAVTADAVSAAAAARLHPAEAVAVVVGDAGVVGADLEATGLGAVEVVPDED